MVLQGFFRRLKAKNGIFSWFDRQLNVAVLMSILYRNIDFGAKVLKYKIKVAQRFVVLNLSYLVLITCNIHILNVYNRYVDD